MLKNIKAVGVLGLIVLTVGSFLYFNREKKHPILASIGDNKIYSYEIDNTIRLELYNIFYKLYSLRKNTLDKYIERDLIQRELSLKKISKSDLVEQFVNLNYRQSKYFVLREKFKSYYFDKEAESGNTIIDSVVIDSLTSVSYYNLLYKKLIDSLKDKYSVKTFLRPPLNPYEVANLSSIHYTGNLKSNLSFIEVSDPECDNCRNNSEIYKSLYNKYKDKMKFGYVAYASYANLYTMALESKVAEEHFWVFKDSLYSYENLLDTNAILSIAASIGIDSYKLLNEVKSKNLADKLMNNFELISSYGIYATPTIIINNRTVYNPGSLDEIENLIAKELN